MCGQDSCANLSMPAMNIAEISLVSLKRESLEFQKLDMMAIGLERLVSQMLISFNRKYLIIIMIKRGGSPMADRALISWPKNPSGNPLMNPMI